MSFIPYFYWNFIITVVYKLLICSKDLTLLTLHKFYIQPQFFLLINLNIQILFLWRIVFSTNHPYTIQYSVCFYRQSSILFSLQWGFHCFLCFTYSLTCLFFHHNISVVYLFPETCMNDYFHSYSIIQTFIEINK